MSSTSELSELVAKVKSNPEQITLSQAIAAIESQYDVVPRPFSVGTVHNEAGECVMTATILSAGRVLNLSRERTLWLFGEIYREYTPSGVKFVEYIPPEVYPGYAENMHANIRTFMQCGWDGVSFPEGLALQDKNLS